MNDLPKLYFTMEAYLFPMLEVGLPERTCTCTNQQIDTLHCKTGNISNLLQFHLAIDGGL